MNPISLRRALTFEPRELRFGTSGRRGEVIHLTQLEIYINVRAELEYLQSLPAGAGRINRGDTFLMAADLRPSSASIAAAIVQAIRDAGMQPVNCGHIPTPALTFHALQTGKGSIMITGSHIPFDRNGYKTNSARGELLKSDEAPINTLVAQVRQRIYGQPFASSLFNERGMLKKSPVTPPVIDAARDAVLPLLCVLFAARQQGIPVAELFARLPRRFSRAALLKNCPRTSSQRIVEWLTRTDDRALSQYFSPAAGFGAITGRDTTDGVRLTFQNGDVAHVRPSGNADELRIYAVADTDARANELTRHAVSEPNGLLRQLEQAVG